MGDAEKPNLNPGDVVFFKIVKKSSRHNKFKEIAFKGHGFGVLLGIVPPFAQDPPESHLMRLMGAAGYLSFDDVADFFGNEIGAQAVTKFEDKYYGKVVEPEVGVDPGVPGADKTSRLLIPSQNRPIVDTRGVPVSSGKEDDVH